MNQKRVLVIGGGISGIACLVHLKAEGITPICYEKTDNYGGLWYYRKDAKYGEASIMPTTTINHSKEMGAYSNFPPKKELSNYMRHFEVYQYIKDYANHFDCEKYVHCNMEVLHVTRADDYEKTGRWVVKTKNVLSGETLTELFDGVLVASGHINRPLMPNLKGQEKFTGRIMHTHSLKEVEEFQGQNIVVVGMGCSALDAAVDLSRVAKQVYLSTRSGCFVLNRAGRNGYPIDSILLRRYLTMFIDLLPTNFISWYAETFYNDIIFDHRLYYTKPRYHFLSKEPVVNDHIPFKLLSGTVIQKGDVQEISENGVLFDGDHEFTSVDTIVIATGYSWDFPVEDGIITQNKDRINLYKCMYPPHLCHPTLAIIGFLHPNGPGFPLWEIQARWAAYLLSGHGSLPSEDMMMKDIIKRYDVNKMRYVPSDKISVRVDYVQYLDEIAVQMGVKPNLLKYLFRDFPLFLKLAFGPSLPYQYRLEGHGKWEGARDAIMKADERIQWPLRRKKEFKKGFLRYVIDYIVNLIPVNVYVWK